MAPLHEIVTHPMRSLQRARWKAGLFARAFRKTWLGAPRWVRACNRRLERVDYGPVHIFLEPASACNLRCPMCPTGAGRITREHGRMDLDLVRKLADEIDHRPEQVGLWLGGEPLLNPQLGEMVRILRRKDLPVGIHTNATRLTSEWAETLIDAGLQFISFSFDGVDRDYHARMRPGADYDEVLGHIRGFLEMRRRKNSPTPRVTIQTVVAWENEEVHPYGVQFEPPPEVVALFEGLGVDEYSTIIANAWSGALDDVPITAPIHTDTGLRMACTIPYTDLTIAWNGDAVTCCGDLDARGVLGNLYRESLYELWNNENYQRLRRDMHTDAILKHPLCGRCERIWTVPPHPLDYELRLTRLRYRLRF